ncbi:DNA polymerase I [Prosthecobacter dejongeii]|uniref:DNA polymerase I n=1 Tax=Prosthecobacter dejongeii TaxID=48465 RepID=A0A7W8DRM9_9BACT|nr:DNA polymerase I [Prosthecobacter dejongeii]MBB5040054.1 DNA polymerase-1 [Prosthecobacter dejongeii]
MSKRLFLLDGMALLYRAHFAFIKNPIRTSDGLNTSALYGFTNTLLDIIKSWQPTHLAVVLDTSAPTPRHEIFPEYKAQREEMPEDLSLAIPQIHRLCAAMNVPLLTRDGYEADDIIGILAKRSEGKDFETYMVTPDKDFGQLVSDSVKIYKPGRQGSDVEILGVAEVCARWGIERPEQVVDILALMGDAVDNIPGIPGFGEKTATSLIQQYGSLENLIANAGKLKGKQKEKVEQNVEKAILSKQLATIMHDAPLEVELDSLGVKSHDDEALKALFTEFEFNSLGKRLFGDEFKAGRGRQLAKDTPSTATAASDLFSMEETTQQTSHNLRTLADTEHKYHLIRTPEERRDFISQLQAQPRFCFDLETTSLDPRDTQIVGIAFSWQANEGWFVLFPRDPAEAASVLEEFRGIFTYTAPALEVTDAPWDGGDTTTTAQPAPESGVEKIGHNLKFDLSVMLAHGLEVAGPFFDTMLAHSLIEPDQRHGMDYLAESMLGYTPVPITALIGTEKNDLFSQATMADVAEADPQKITDYAAEDADVTWQLAEKLRALLPQHGAERVFYEIECPLLPVLTRMENRGVAIDVQALREFGLELEKRANDMHHRIQEMAGGPFNLNSPKQLGEILFEKLKLTDKPKKTATGQYQTNEQVLQSLLGLHPIIADILEYREVTKLKNTYVDTLPGTVSKVTGRVHTTFHQLMAATGRMASSNPNLQNIPIRSDSGKEIRKAFVPGQEGWVLLSADYSQVELRVMAALSEDAAMIEAFQNGHDIHQATAARVYGVTLDGVLPEMRRTAKMVNFGIIYGISAFGLSQRLGIPRGEAATIIENYFKQFPGIHQYMEQIVKDAKRYGYVETITGRRRIIRDIASGNASVRGGAERMAMNTPIQGTAADMIKLAMINVDKALEKAGLKTRMLLQVHDELLFEVPEAEVEQAKSLILKEMSHALTLGDVPVGVEAGTGQNWLQAH